uniref:Uncharacterized protein n=1 Tax=Melopsittacus undulatus TaxID=13146 RepID=A0A8V5G101_MELUD
MPQLFEILSGAAPKPRDPPSQAQLLPAPNAPGAAASSAAPHSLSGLTLSSRSDPQRPRPRSCSSPHTTPLSPARTGAGCSPAPSRACPQPRSAQPPARRVPVRAAGGGRRVLAPDGAPRRGEARPRHRLRSACGRGGAAAEACGCCRRCRSSESRPRRPAELCQCRPGEGNCSCCKECMLCLGTLWDECCDCVGMCNPRNYSDTPPTSKSTVEELHEPIPSLFRALTEGDTQLNWNIVSFPVAEELSHHENLVSFLETVNQPQHQNVSVPSNNVHAPYSSDKEHMCTVVYFDDCMSIHQCKISCESMGASKYRWFHNACCTCCSKISEALTPCRE